MMNSANLPSQADLSSLYGSWNPMAVYKGLQNQDLAGQFRDQAFADNQNTVQAGTLRNDQSAIMNPLNVQKQQSDNIYQDLINAGKTNTNTSEALDLGNKQSLNSDKLAAERAKLKTMFSDEQLSQMSNDIWKAHVDNIKSGDPTKIQETGSLLDLLGGPSKAADRSQTRNLKEGDWLNSQILANIGAQSREGVAAMRGAGKTPASWQSQFNKLPTSSKKDTAAAAIATGRNPYTGDELTEEELAAFKASYDSAVGTLDAGNAARGQAQGITAGVDSSGKVNLKNKNIPSTGGASKMSNDDLVNFYLNKNK
jgi:hypothetical protein